MEVVPRLYQTQYQCYLFTSETRLPDTATQTGLYKLSAFPKSAIWLIRSQDMELLQTIKGPREQTVQPALSAVLGWPKSAHYGIYKFWRHYFETLLPEKDFKKLKEENREVKLKANRVILRLYGTKKELPNMGRVKTIMHNDEGKRIKTNGEGRWGGEMGAFKILYASWLMRHI